MRMSGIEITGPMSIKAIARRIDAVHDLEAWLGRDRPAAYIRVHLYAHEYDDNEAALSLRALIEDNDHRTLRRVARGMT